MTTTWIEMTKELLLSLAMAKMPHELTVPFGVLTAGRGAFAGRLLLHRTENGVDYKFFEDPAPKALQPAPAELVRNHTFTDLESLKRYVEGWTVEEGAAYVATCPGAPAAVRVLWDEKKPELGMLSMSVPRHPAWRRWAARTGPQMVELGHHAFADLLLDNREDLDEPMVAQAVSAFRAARTVEYDADLGQDACEAVRVRWKGQGGQPGAVSAVEVPREFTANIPAFTGLWPAGEDPRFTARFRVRVMPGQGDDAAPIFRVLWVNYEDFELEAARAVVATVAEALTPTLPVYAGTADSRHFIVPQAALGR